MARPMYFLVSLAVIIDPPEEARRLVPDLQEELDARPHLTNPRVWWDGNTQRTHVEVIDKSDDMAISTSGVAEEIFEAVAAVMLDFETMRVEIVETRLYNDPYNILPQEHE
jgi:hypothetical protein